MESLGLMSYRRYLKINEDSLNLSSYLGDCLRYLTHSRFTSVLVQVGTLTYNKSARKYLRGAFNLLVMFGVGVVVWFKLEHYPVGFDPFPINPALYPTDVFNLFKHPNSHSCLEWGEWFVYLTLHADLVNRVLSILTHLNGSLAHMINLIISPTSFPSQENY